MGPRINGGDAESLVIFSVVSLMFLVMLCGVPWFRRPEAGWPPCASRLSSFLHVPRALPAGRPYILTDAVVITILFLWTRP